MTGNVFEKEIEFYKGSKLIASLTFVDETFPTAGWLTFCYAYQDTVDYPVEDFDKLWNAPYHGKTVGKIIESFPGNNVVIY